MDRKRKTGKKQDPLGDYHNRLCEIKPIFDVGKQQQREILGDNLRCKDFGYESDSGCIKNGPVTGYQCVRREGMGKCKISILSFSGLMVSSTVSATNRDWGLQNGGHLEGNMS